MLKIQYKKTLKSIIKNDNNNNNNNNNNNIHSTKMIFTDVEYLHGNNIKNINGEFIRLNIILSGVIPSDIRNDKKKFIKKETRSLIKKYIKLLNKNYKNDIQFEHINFIIKDNSPQFSPSSKFIIEFNILFKKNIIDEVNSENLIFDDFDKILNSSMVYQKGKGDKIHVKFGV